MMRKEISQHIAGGLLQIKAIKLNIANPFTWASGWKSPIYCDNRITLSHPGLRNYIKESFSLLIRENYPAVQKIAGVATAGIAHGALVADMMNLPFVYVRAKQKNTEWVPYLLMHFKNQLTHFQKQDVRFLL